MADPEETPEEEPELLARIEARLARIEERLDAASPGEEDGPSPPDAAFERRMNLFVIGMNVAMAAGTYASYRYLPTLFPVAFGLFFVFLILAVGLVIDDFVLPAPTFRRISTDAVAVAIFWASILFLAVSGVRIGTTILSDPFGGEEGRARPPPTSPAAVTSAERTLAGPDGAYGARATDATTATTDPAARGAGAGAPDGEGEAAGQ